MEEPLAVHVAENVAAPLAVRLAEFVADVICMRDAVWDLDREEVVVGNFDDEADLDRVLDDDEDLVVDFVAVAMRVNEPEAVVVLLGVADIDRVGVAVADRLADAVRVDKPDLVADCDAVDVCVDDRDRVALGLFPARVSAAMRARVWGVPRPEAASQPCAVPYPVQPG